MYEEITYEVILQRMLNAVPTNVDKREGSIIYDALSPCAIELQNMYIELDIILKETYGATASRDYLILRAMERGLTPYEASYAILKGEFDIEIPEESRFTCGDLNYMAIEFIEQVDDFYYYKMTCEELGVGGNRNFGDLIPIQFIQGLTHAKMVELLIPAEDEEDTEAFRTRYLNSFDPKAYGGNIEDYKQKTNSIAGVGATKVTPVWNGGGTVLLTIIDSEFNMATPTLIEYVQNEIDPTGDHGGYGVAPIGHVVTVQTVEEVQMKIECSITFKNGYTFENQKSYIESIISEYLQELRGQWAEEDYLIVRLIQIEARLIELEGVIDITGTKIRGMAENYTLNVEEIPVMGELIHYD